MDEGAITSFPLIAMIVVLHAPLVAPFTPPTIVNVSLDNVTEYVTSSRISSNSSVINLCLEPKYISSADICKDFSPV